MYFLDGDPVGYSCQNGRKSKLDVYWFSDDCADRVKKYIMSLIIEDDDCVYETEDIDKDAGDVYFLDYNSQVLDFSKGTHHGKKFIVEEVEYGIAAKKLKIFTEDDERIEINVNEVEFQYRLMK